MPKFTIGRKRRQNVKREPNGRAQRDRGIDPKAIAQLQPHRRLVPADVAHDPKAECIMGRLCLNGWLTEVQYQAGVKYRTAIARYRSIIEAPRGEVSMSGVIVGPWGGGNGLSEERQAEIKNEYMRAYEALESSAGNAGARDVAHCVHDNEWFALARVRCGLDALARHYGLTFARKSEIVRNRR